MKQLMHVDEFLSEIQRQDLLKEDFVAPQGQMNMDETGGILRVGQRDFRLSEIAHGQLAERTKIPRAYYDRCGEIPGLRAANVNDWLHKEPSQRRMIRTAEGRARAILSDRYRALDNILIAGATLPVLAANPNVKVTAANLGDARMYLQMVFPGIQGEVKVGDVVQYGLTITNSEVGMGALDIKSFLYRLVCRNGMVAESIQRKYHVGRKIGEAEEDYSLYSDETIKAELKSFQLRLRDTLLGAVNEERFQALLSKMRTAAAEPIPALQMQEAVQNVTKRYSLTEMEMGDIFNRVMAESDFSRWGLANSITAQAHSTDDADRQYHLEKVGYEVAAMPGKEFKAIVAA